jgi:hypothetical protein
LVVLGIAIRSVLHYNRGEKLAFRGSATWHVIQKPIVHAPIRVPGMASAVNASCITANTARFRAVFFQKTRKKRTTGRSRIFSGITTGVLKADYLR